MSFSIPQALGLIFVGGIPVSLQNTLALTILWLRWYKADATGKEQDPRNYPLYVAATRLSLQEVQKQWANPGASGEPEW